MPAMTSSLAALAMIGGGLSAFGQYQEGVESKKAADYNAAIAESEAGLIRSNAALNLYRQRKQLQAVTGEQIAGYARAGVSVSTGSPLDVVADSISNAELEMEIGQFNLRQEALRRESEAKMLRKYGREDLRLAKYRAVGTLLTTAVETGTRIGKEKIGSSGYGTNLIGGVSSRPPKGSGFTGAYK